MSTSTAYKIRTNMPPEARKKLKAHRKNENRNFNNFWKRVIKTPQYQSNQAYYDEIKKLASTKNSSTAASLQRHTAKDQLYRLFPDQDTAKAQKYRAFRTGSVSEWDNQHPNVVPNSPQEVPAAIEHQHDSSKKNKTSQKERNKNRMKAERETGASSGRKEDREGKNDESDVEDDETDGEDEVVSVVEMLTVQYRMYRKNKSSRERRQHVTKNIARILAAQDKNNGGSFSLRDLDSMSRRDIATFVSDKLADINDESMDGKVYMGIVKMFSKEYKS